MKKLLCRQQLFDRWLNGGSFKKIIFVLVFAVLIFIVASLFIMIPNDNIIGYYTDCNDTIKSDTDKEHKLWQLYYFYADPGNQMTVDYPEDKYENIARWIALIMSTLGSIFLSGLLISTITNVFERRADKWRTGFSYYKLKNHIVIIGSDQMVHGLVNQLCESCKNAIVVLTSKDVEQMRNSLHATLRNKKNHERIIVNYGLRDSEEYLSAINVVSAKEVYILGDTSEFDDIESFHDSLNVQCLTLIAKLCRKVSRKNLPCHVLFDYKTTYHVFQYADLSSDITDYVDFHPFNFHDFWARKVLVANYSKEENIEYKPLDYEHITSKNSDKFVHLIIIGMSKMGQAMALQAAHIAHFPNYKRKKTKITFIDRNGKLEMGEFKQKCGELFKLSHSTYIDADAWSEANEQRLPGEPDINSDKFITHYHIADEYMHLVNKNDNDRDFIDIEWEFIKGDDHNPIVQKKLEQYIADKNAIITVAVCLNLTHASLRSAMHLPKEYYEKDIPILVQQRKTPTMALTLNGNGFSEDKRKMLLYKNIKPFGMVYDCYDLHLASSVEICKRIAATYDYFSKYENNPIVITQEDVDRVWNETAITKKWSNIFAAASIPTKLRCLGIDWNINKPCHLDDLTEEQIALLAEIEHNRWNIEELLLGYRPVNETEDKKIDSYRFEKSYYKKRFIHYDIRPYDELKTDDKGRKANV